MKLPINNMESTFLYSQLPNSKYLDVRHELQAILETNEITIEAAQRLYDWTVDYQINESLRNANLDSIGTDENKDLDFHDKFIAILQTVADRVIQMDGQVNQILPDEVKPAKPQPPKVQSTTNSEDDEFFEAYSIEELEGGKIPLHLLKIQKIIDSEVIKMNKKQVKRIKELEKEVSDLKKRLETISSLINPG